jgi:hypothetical protein
MKSLVHSLANVKTVHTVMYRVVTPITTAEEIGASALAVALMLVNSGAIVWRQ